MKIGQLYNIVTLTRPSPEILDVDQLQRFHHPLTMSLFGILSGRQIIRLGPRKCILERDVGILPILVHVHSDR